MITENERDRRTAAWLIETYGAEAVAEAETRIAGARKPYPSNIAKVLGASLPEALKRTENAAARQKLAGLRRMLDGKALRLHKTCEIRPLLNAERPNIADRRRKPRQSF
jgi:hypothetical protein|nr:protein A [Neisseria gonorrhoeae]